MHGEIVKFGYDKLCTGPPAHCPSRN